MKRVWHIFLCFFGLLFFSVTVLAQTPSRAQQVAQANRGTVTLMAGGIAGTYTRFAADLAAVLDDEDVRLLTILGKGSQQNINDLLYLRGIDVAIVQADVMDYLREQPGYQNINQRIHYITKLYNEEFHLLVKGEDKTLRDLAGQKVNVDENGSGTAITASLVFDALNLDVEFTRYDQLLALNMLKNGEIAALAYVVGKPAPLFQGISPQDDLHFLPIVYRSVLGSTYLPTRLTHADYPNLIDAGEDMPTIAVGSLMAVYNWRQDNPRRRRVSRFVESFFENFNALQEPFRHPKWREVSLSAAIPGWTRFTAARNWLEANNPR
jgi:TRAP transporter TAXI family solute receptor